MRFLSDVDVPESFVDLLKRVSTAKVSVIKKK